VVLKNRGMLNDFLPSKQLPDRPHQCGASLEASIHWFALNLYGYYRMDSKKK